MSALIALLALLGAPEEVRAAPPLVTLASDAEAQWVPFTLTPGNQIRFVMLVDGIPVQALLDTGVSDSAISTRLARRLGVRATIPATADAIGGAVPFGWAAGRRLLVGGLAREGGRIGVVDLSALDALSDGPIDALIGADLLGCCALDIDFSARRFRLLASGRLPFRGSTLPLRFVPGVNAMLTEVAIGDGRIARLLIDTGDGASLTVSRAGLAAAALPPAPVTTAIAYGLAGPVESELRVVEGLRLGSLPARPVELRIETRNPFGARSGYSGRIGTGLLGQYRVLLDPAAGRLVLAATPRAEAPVQRSTSGLLVAPDGAALRVIHVMRGGPGEAQGWRAGDRICAIDGQPVPADYARSPLANWSVSPAGRTIRLTLCTGGDRALRLAAFY